MKAFILLLVVVVIIGGSVGGAFIGGIAVGKGQSDGPLVADIQAPGGTTADAATTETSGFQQISPEQVANFRQQVQSGELSAEDLAQLRQQFGAGRTGAVAGGEATAGSAFRSGLTGTVKTVEDNEITINTAQGDLVATVGESTTIRLFNDGAISDLIEGMAVTVVGTTDEFGALQAATITAAPEGTELGAGGAGGFGGGGRGGGRFGGGGGGR